MADLGTARAPARASGDHVARRALAHPWTVVVAATALALLPLLWQVGLLGPDLPWSASAGSDHAGLENDVRTALRGDLLLGTSSRIGVRNLGPFHGYWIAPWYKLTGEGLGGMVLATWVLHTLAVTAVVAVVRSMEGGRAAWAVAIALCLALLRIGPAGLSDPFNPAYTLPAALVATVGAAALARGAWRFLPLVALAVSAGAQVHLVSAPALGAIAAVAVGLALRRSRPTRRQVVTAGIVVLVLWAPTVVDQVGGSGNLRLLASAVAEGPGTPDQPLGQPPLSGSRRERTQSAVQLTTLTTAHASAHATLPGTALGRPPATTPRTALALAVLASAALAAWLGRRRAPLGSLVVSLALGGALGTYLPSAGMTRGFFPYYMAPLVGYGLALGVGVALLASAALRPTRRQLAGISAVVVLATGVACHAQGDVGLLSPLRIPRPVDQLHFVDRVVDIVPADCAADGIALSADYIQVADVWTLVVAFDKRGIPTTVAPELERYAGPGHVRTGRERVFLRVPSLVQFHARAVPPGALDVRACS